MNGTHVEVNGKGKVTKGPSNVKNTKKGSSGSKRGSEKSVRPVSARDVRDSNNLKKMGLKNVDFNTLRNRDPFKFGGELAKIAKSLGVSGTTKESMAFFGWEDSGRLGDAKNEWSHHSKLEQSAKDACKDLLKAASKLNDKYSESYDKFLSGDEMDDEDVSNAKMYIKSMAYIQVKLGNMGSAVDSDDMTAGLTKKDLDDIDKLKKSI